MALTPHDVAKKFITKIELAPNEVYEIHDPAAVHELGDLGLDGALLIFKGIVDTVAELPSTGNKVGDVRLVREDSGEYIWTNENKWELMDAHIVADHTHTVTYTTKNSTASASVLETAGSVTAGSDVVFNAGSHTDDSFEQGDDEFTFDPGSYEAPSLTDTYVAPSFTQGTDEFTPNVPTTIDTTKFSGGSFVQGTDTFNAGSTSFTQGTDSFTANTPTVIDTTKFNAGSASITDGAVVFPVLDYDAPTFTPGKHTVIDTTKFTAPSASLSGGSAVLEDTVDPTWEATVDENGVLSFSFGKGNHGTVKYTAPELTFDEGGIGTGFYTPGTDATFTAGSASLTGGSYTKQTLNYTAPSLGTGFYKAGTAASFTPGIDEFSYTAPTFTQGKDIFTAAKLNAGFYTPGTAASFVPGTDVFNPGSHSITFDEGSYTAPSASFKQGVDKFTAGTYTAPTLTGGKATKVTLPTFSTVNNIWVGEKEETLTTSEAIEAAE